jgi:hypothetical protein
MAQTWMPDGPIDTPNFIESWNEEADAPPANLAEPETDADAETPIRIRTRRSDPEAPAEQVAVSTVEEDERPRPRRLPAGIDQYPKNPRCYVAGRYVPAPPLCPN